MSREALHESLSAVMDNEANELELRRVLSAADGEAVKATWLRYQIARSAMHRELKDPHLDLAAAVSAAIADDSTPVRKASSGWLSGLGRVAVAASVTVAVLAGFRFYNQEMAGDAGLLARQPASPATGVAHEIQGNTVLAGFTTGAAADTAQGSEQDEAWREEKLPEYVRQHVLRAGYSEAAGPDTAN